MVPGWLLPSGHMDGTRLVTSKWTYGWYQADYFKVDIWMVTRLITSKWTYGWYQADYFKVDIWMVPSRCDGRQQVGKPSF